MNKYKVCFTASLSYEVWADSKQDALETAADRFRVREGTNNRLIFKRIETIDSPHFPLINS